MIVALIAFSPDGATLATKIKASLEAEMDISIYLIRRHHRDDRYLPFDSVHTLTADLFYRVDALCFIAACGIAVRAVAPLLVSKLKDPAVVVCDETGRFALSLLSGHAGGANELAQKIAQKIGATPVITTASDCHLANGELSRQKNLVLGIGCRRGLTAETIERAVTIMLWDQRIPLLRISAMATIDVKKDEAGLQEFASAHHIPLHFFKAAQLSSLQGDFTASERVKKAVGVDNVCERAATLYAEKGHLILPKTTRDGVAIAVFERTTT